MSIIGFLIIIFFAFLFLLFVIFYKDIMSFLFPSSWVKVTILELDNNVRSMLLKKTPDLKFEFKEGNYNLYHTGEIIEKVKERKEAIRDKEGKITGYNIVKEKYTENNKESAIYRSGRLGQFFYKEGNSDPLDYRTGEITGNPQISKQISKIELGKLFSTEVTFGEELFKKFGLFILVGVVVLLIILIFRGG